MKLLFPALGALAAFAIFASVAQADEGMWTYDNFPSAAVNAKYGTHIDQAWLDRVREASVRLSSGCSASIVTGEGRPLFALEAGGGRQLGERASRGRLQPDLPHQLR